MEGSKVVAILTGIVAVALGVGYLVLVQLLDWRGAMVPAPVDEMMTLGLRFLI
ncbi:MAG: hypothetical protein ACK456_14175 [Pseudanabaenaceae cyanobacterium]